MAVLEWDNLEDRRYEYGLDHGVLYQEDGIGVVWNGLIQVQEASGDNVDALYYDGQKFNDVVTVGDFEGTLSAYTFPDEFMVFDGSQEDQRGVTIHNQQPGRFGLSFRTFVGTPNVPKRGYKIHVIWNLTAISSDKDYKTTTEDPEVMEFEWDISAIPEEIPGYRPTAHIVIDTEKMDPWLVKDIEDILYGTETDPAHLPSMKSLVAFIQKWDRLIIEDLGNGMWAAHAIRDGIITMLDDTTFQIETDTATYLNPTTYDIWSSDKNEEDV